MATFIKPFSQISLRDIPVVGGKNASLGELFCNLSEDGIKVPDGFATTATAFWQFIDDNHLRIRLQEVFSSLNKTDFSNLKEVGLKARSLIKESVLSREISDSILDAYRNLCQNENCSVAVRSSATAEDLPEASFAGQHDSFLNIQGETELLKAVQNCFASLFTDRAIKYRYDKGFSHDKIALSVGVQKMVRSDKGSSGVAFTLEPESGFRDIIHISGVWGLGENLVQGTVTPDEFLVFKPSLVKGKKAILQKRLGSKSQTMIYADLINHSSIINIDTPAEKQEQFVLNDDEIMQLSRWAYSIEKHYQKPMDIEWAKDGNSGQIYIIQARPETVQATKNVNLVQEFHLSKTGKELVSGQAVGNKVVSGIARLLHSPRDGFKLKSGEIVVTDLTSPDWDPVLKTAGAIITNKGGRTSHASIVARELGVPAVVGCIHATDTIKDGEWITVSCCEGKTGKVYEGQIPFSVTEIDFSTIARPGYTEVMLILGDPDQAFKLSFYPNDGVGLMRIEFIINHFIQIHPMALAKFEEIKDEEVRKKIDDLTHHYKDKKEYFIEKLAEGIATIAAAFYPKDVIVRMSDFKTNEYANLIGGRDFEPEEENPMLGFRGASRYYHDLYRDGFALECAAIKKVRQEMGLGNVKVMIPFCRTVKEARKVLHIMEENGLDRNQNSTLQIYMMAEIPSNVLLAEQFAAIFDGFSIGSNDLTQLTLGIDRDSAIISNLFSEQDEAAMIMIGTMIEKAVEAEVKIGLCGQAPSDDPSFAQFLVQKGINSIAFNPDAVIRGIENICLAESKLNRQRMENASYKSNHESFIL